MSFDSAQDGKTGGRVKILSNVVASSAEIQAKYGGVIPEQASREQLKSIIPVIEESLRQAQCKPDDLDAIAVTRGPGLIGPLLIGVETAKTLAQVWGKPLIGVNHLMGHLYANWIDQKPLRHNTYPIPHFPLVGLLISGGHTDLVLMKDHHSYEYLGGTRDDAVGECFDKSARLLGLPYPGGALLSKLADSGKPGEFKLPRPMANSQDFDFSFSGLKTAVANLIKDRAPLTDQQKADLALELEQAIIEVLVKKTIAAAKTHKVEQIIVAGGVAANRKIIEALKTAAMHQNITIFAPPVELCTDNGAMIAAAALFQTDQADPLTLQANPNLSFAY